MYCRARRTACSVAPSRGDPDIPRTFTSGDLDAQVDVFEAFGLANAHLELPVLEPRSHDRYFRHQGIPLRKLNEWNGNRHNSRPYRDYRRIDAREIHAHAGQGKEEPETRRTPRVIAQVIMSISISETTATPGRVFEELEIPIPVKLVYERPEIHTDEIPEHVLAEPAVRMIG